MFHSHSRLKLPTEFPQNLLELEAGDQSAAAWPAFSAEIGKIGKALQALQPEDTDLQRQTGRIVRNFAVVGVSFCLMVVVVYGLTRVDGRTHDLPDSPQELPEAPHEVVEYSLLASPPDPFDPDDNFASIVKAVRMGRRIFDNLRKAMTFIFSVHIPIGGAVLIAALLADSVKTRPLRRLIGDR